MRLAAVEPLQLTAEYVVPEENEEEAPFAPPPADDIFGLDECGEEEDTVFVAAADAPLVEPEAPVVAEAAPVEVEALEEEFAAEEEFEDDAPFDPPEFDDEPVFSPPASAQIEPVAAPPPAKPEAPKPLQPMEMPRERAVPAITIYASWDRPETEKLLQDFARDPRLARAETHIVRGGLEGAAAHFVTGADADLVILDTTLQGKPMLAGLDRLIAVMPAKARIVVIGAVNDIGLLRELAARNVSDYIVPPAGAEDLARSACQLFAEADTAHVIAVIGARGGIGASTIAHNIAWSIAERQCARALLVDLDLSFGSAAFNFKHEPSLSTADVMRAEADAEDVLTRALTPLTPRLQLLSAPAAVESVDLDVEAFEAMLAEVRRASPHVVLDLPHVWEPWVRSALRNADEVVVVSGADLASLRNADNMLKLMRSERDKPSAPVVVLSMMGVPKRPEIPLKDFSEALCVRPAQSFAFEPDLFAKAEAAGQMLYETMADAKAALQIDTLATLLTGREATAKPEPRTRRPVKPAQAPEAPQAEPTTTAEAPKPEAPMPELPVLDLVLEAPLEPPPPRKPAKRRVARTGFIALQAPPPKRPTGLVRAAAAMLALVLAGAWYVQHQREATSQTEAANAFRA